MHVHCTVLSLEFTRCPRVEHIWHHHASHRKVIRHWHQGSKVGNATGVVAQTTLLHIVVLLVLCVVSARRRDTSRRQGTGKVKAKTHQLTSASENTEDEVPLLQLGKGQASPITADVTVNDVPVTMEVDTGAAVSVMSCQQQ